MAAELQEAAPQAQEGVVTPTSGKRKALKRFFRKLTGASKMSPLQVAQFLASPGEVDAAYAGMTRDELVELLKEEGADEKTISHALTSVLPYLPGQEAPGVPSMEAA